MEGAHCNRESVRDLDKRIGKPEDQSHSFNEESKFQGVSACAMRCSVTFSSLGFWPSVLDVSELHVLHQLAGFQRITANSMLRSQGV